MLDVIQNDSLFTNTILFSNEAYLTREEGSLRTIHKYDSTNFPHSIVSWKVQHKFCINKLAGILADHLLKPHVLHEHFNDTNYFLFLKHVFPGLMQGINTTLHQNMFFMHDVAKAHFAILVCNHLDATYLKRWIRRGGPIAWVSQTLDLNPLDFILWGNLNSVVYYTPVDTLDDLIARIVVTIFAIFFR